MFVARFPVVLRVIVTSSPAGPGLEFGAQDKRGALHPGQPVERDRLAFDLPASAESDPRVRHPRLSGPFVHGPSVAPFAYLGLRRLAAGPGEWERRWKVPLEAITAEQLERASRIDGAVLLAVVEDASRVTVGLGAGWSVVEAAPGVDALS